MNDNVGDLVLEQLRLIRSDIARMEGKIEDLEVKVDSHTGVVMALGHYMHAIEHRVEKIEEKIGA